MFSVQLLSFLSFRVTLYTLQLVLFIAFCGFLSFLPASCCFPLSFLFLDFTTLLCGDEACQRRLVAAWPEESATLTFAIYMDGLNEP
ncbi:hypothetical protein V8C34DRAFT_58323 [Trichoderma compactum]